MELLAAVSEFVSPSPSPYTAPSAHPTPAMERRGPPLDVLGGTNDLVFLICACVSVVASLCVVGSYLALTELRQHPASLIVGRSLSDIVFMVQFVVSFGILDSKSAHSFKCAPGVSCPQCVPYAFLAESTLIISEIYPAVLALDLAKSSSNPFFDSNDFLKRYHAVSVGAGLTVGLALIYGFGEAVSNANVIRICLVDNEQDSTSWFNPYLWGFVYAPIILFYLLAGWALLKSRARLRRGLPNTFKVRTEVLRNTQFYVLTYTVYWGLAAASYFGLFLVGRGKVPHHSNHTNHTNHTNHSEVNNSGALAGGGGSGGSGGLWAGDGADEFSAGAVMAAAAGGHSGSEGRHRPPHGIPGRIDGKGFDDTSFDPAAFPFALIFLAGRGLVTLLVWVCTKDICRAYRTERRRRLRSKCRGCGGNVVKTTSKLRYICTVCEDFVICSKCQATGYADGVEGHVAMIRTSKSQVIILFSV